MFFNNLQKLLRQNIREYGMYIALFIIMVIFTITTNGLFISSRNISNLMNQTGYIAVLAVGMTLVIVIRHIDLSIGFLAGFLGAVAAIALAFWHLPVMLVILLVLGLGVIAGLANGFLVAQMKIPSFVASLAGWLIYRGAILLATMGTGSIVISNVIFNAIGNGFIPDIPDIGILPGVHKITLLLGLITIILLLIMPSVIEKRNRFTNSKYCQWICSYFNWFLYLH
jgi:putative multiple sugar transport system permease protein